MSILIVDDSTDQQLLLRTILNKAGHQDLLVVESAAAAYDHLGIDQGPIIAMVENYRTGLIWRVMRTNPYIKAGLKRAGFTGGWLDQ